MPFDRRYLALNTACSEAVGFAEDTGEDLIAYLCARPKPQTLVTHDQLDYLKESRQNSILGFTHPNPVVRMAALSLFGPVGFAAQFVRESYPNVSWEIGEDCAQNILDLAISDSDMEVRHSAVNSFSLIYYKLPMPGRYAQSLCNIALATDDMVLRFNIYQLIIWRQHISEANSHTSVLNPLTSLKYLRLPIFFDEQQVRRIAGLSENHLTLTQIITAPPAPVAWWHRMFFGIRRK